MTGRFEQVLHAQYKSGWDFVLSVCSSHDFPLRLSEPWKHVYLATGIPRAPRLSCSRMHLHSVPASLSGVDVVEHVCALRTSFISIVLHSRRSSDTGPLAPSTRPSRHLYLQLQPSSANDFLTRSHARSDLIRVGERSLSSTLLGVTLARLSQLSRARPARLEQQCMVVDWRFLRAERHSGHLRAHCVLHGPECAGSSTVFRVFRF